MTVQKELYEAITKKDLAEVTRLLDAGASANAPTEKGSWPLQTAAHNKQADIVALLLARGADPNARSEHGRTALHDAIWCWEPPIAQLLLDAGADVHAADKSNWTPIWMTDELAPFTFLLEHGAKVDMIAKNGETLLARMAEGASNSNQAEGLQILAKLEELGLRVADAKPDEHGQTLLMSVVGRSPYNGTNEIAKWLLARGADAKAQNIVGVTALHIACKEDDADMVDALLAAGADPNVRIAKEWYQWPGGARPGDLIKSYSSDKKRMKAALKAAGEIEVAAPNVALEIRGHALVIDTEDLAAALAKMIEVVRDIPNNILKHPQYDDRNEMFEWSPTEHEDEAELFAACAEDAELRPKIAKYVALIVAANTKRDGEPYYAHEEQEAGGLALEALVRTGDERYLDLLWDYVKSIDVDHTVHLGQLMDAAREAYGKDKLAEITALLDEQGFQG